VQVTRGGPCWPRGAQLSPMPFPQAQFPCGLDPLWLRSPMLQAPGGSASLFYGSGLPSMAQPLHSLMLSPVLGLRPPRGQLWPPIQEAVWRQRLDPSHRPLLQETQCGCGLFIITGITNFLSDCSWVGTMLQCVALFNLEIIFCRRSCVYIY
jgi:hypothetical protein